MRVVVWKAYGEIDVYSADTPAQLKSIIEAMIAAVEGWGLEKKVELVRGHMVKHPDDFKELTRAFVTMCNAVGPGSHEMFEKIELKQVKELS